MGTDNRSHKVTVLVCGNRSLWSRLCIGTQHFRAATKGSGCSLTSTKDRALPVSICVHQWLKLSLENL
jgi:hypothetical protein